MANLNRDFFTWHCVNCDNAISAKTAPNRCPICGHADIPWSGASAFSLEKENR